MVDVLEVENAYQDLHRMLSESISRTQNCLEALHFRDPNWFLSLFLILIIICLLVFV